ncbi:MAG: TRAM domain-containing protein [Marmoricola sp.]
MSAVDGSEDLVGQRVEVEVGPIAHGGHFVARHEGQVVFVRHALPGEQVTVEITDSSGSFLRGDAVEVHTASDHRVPAPCPLAHPGGCGGCDFQHVELGEQRRLKGAVVTEQLARLAGVEREVEVEAVPGDQDGLRWRTRMQYVHFPDGGRGLRKHRSHDAVVVEDCLIAHPDAREPDRTGPVTERVEAAGRSHDFTVAGDGFWQVHPGAPRVLVETVLAMLAPVPGERALDLYAGVGLFTAFLADAVGSAGSVTAIESDKRATDLATENLAGLPQAVVVRDRVDRALHRGMQNSGGADLVVLDPPRAGAKRQVVRAIAELAPRAVVYVACDPAALARDVGYFAEQDYRLADLRAFDVFPMTHHVECVALFVPRATTR